MGSVEFFIKQNDNDPFCKHPGEPTPALLSDSFSATQNTLRFRSAKNLPKFQETEHPETEKGSKKEKKHKDKQQRSEWQTATG